MAVTGCDADDGAKATPLRTISRAGQIAQPGDVITVHAGIYRERINPPRGGTSDRVFEDFNPYCELINGDWYEARQPYHTGAVYVNGVWLKEAARKADVVMSERRSFIQTSRDETTSRLTLYQGHSPSAVASTTSRMREPQFRLLPWSVVDERRPSTYHNGNKPQVIGAGINDEVIFFER